MAFLALIRYKHSALWAGRRCRPPLWYALIPLPGFRRCVQAGLLAWSVVCLGRGDAPAPDILRGICVRICFVVALPAVVRMSETLSLCQRGTGPRYLGEIVVLEPDPASARAHQWAIRMISYMWG